MNWLTIANSLILTAALYQAGAGILLILLGKPFLGLGWLLIACAGTAFMLQK
jgi:hypothetical protein